ncbi:MAG: 3-oxoacyl-[acyl-carrier-protein] reductase [Bacteroidetes bacterium]|nr:3-oxoacyl-[acyl-carrier-protein] reductase [Bacteroidota bacterium]
MNKPKLEGQVALITGATRGIGKGIALRFAQEGAHVAFTYMQSAEKALALEEELRAMGIQCKGYCSDAGDHFAAEALIQAVLSDFGDLHILVNNAGITRDGLLLRMSEAQWDEVIHTNLKSVYNMTRFASKHMMKQRRGSLINMTSVVGRNGNAGQANYAASKAGVIGFTQSIAKELGARNIRCNAVAPGFIETEMTGALEESTIDLWKKSIPLGRPGSVADVAALCVFLASDDSSYITGQVINVCGGLQTHG